MVAANRAAAVAMVEGPAAGLALLDALATDPRLTRWPPFHLARADLLRRLGRPSDAVAAYRAALALAPPSAECAFIAGRLRRLAPANTD